MDEIILASASTRRKEILNQLKMPFEVIIPDIDEESYLVKPPKALVEALSRAKVEKAAKMVDSNCKKWVIGFDTIVVIRNKILGKPKSRNDAESMLRTLSGRSHSVVSGIAILIPNERIIKTKAVTTKVFFNHLSDEEIDFYLNTNEWQDAAGAYKIQERASLFIKKIIGSYSNIVGLPISEFYGMLRANKFTF